MKQLPISAIIPTAGRFERLCKTIRSLSSQEVSVSEIVVVWVNLPADAEVALRRAIGNETTSLVFEKAEMSGAATQRNRAVELSREPWILFLDDDVDLFPGCLQRLWHVVNRDRDVVGCNAHVTNQDYRPPGIAMRYVLALVGCPATLSLAGRCCGPGLNFLPSRAESHYPYNSVDWLNLGCTLYRRDVLPCPVFLPFFNGYSLLEDCALSLFVRTKGTLATVFQAEIFHDTQPAPYKSGVARREQMEIVNRYFLMTQMLGRDSLFAIAQFWLFQVFSWCLALRTLRGWKLLPLATVGRISGIVKVFIKARSWGSYST